jgi:NADH dehydrogenase
MILVAGGTGRLGSEVVRRLQSRGEQTRVLTRDPTRADHLAGTGTEVVVGDVRDRTTLTAAVAGADVVVSALHGFLGPRGVSPATVDRAGNINLVDAAGSAGAAVVLVSVVGAAPDSPFELFRAKHAAEIHLRGVGVPWSVVRSAAFRETWEEVLRSTRSSTGRLTVFGRGDNPVNFVSVQDVAAVVVEAVLDGGGRGRVIDVEGPEDLTLSQLAAVVAAELGSDAAPRHVPRPLLHLMAITAGLVRPELGRQARAALAMDTTPLAAQARRP